MDATRLVPGLVLDLRYATERNFLGRKVYPVARCLLRRPVAERLARAAAALAADGYRLVAWDCYRPRSIQWEMWKLVPKPGYVADPRQGSNHNRGAAVDVSLASRDGTALEMPTDFDDFTPKAHHGATTPAAAAARREALRRAMTDAGFRINRMEWWHYDAEDARRHPLLDIPLDRVP